jgi:hypothetical protein
MVMALAGSAASGLGKRHAMGAAWYFVAENTGI